MRQSLQDLHGRQHGDMHNVMQAKGRELNRFAAINERKPLNASLSNALIGRLRSKLLIQPSA
jgi:hypothetical protein